MAERLRTPGGCTYRKQGPDFPHLQQWSRCVRVPESRRSARQPTTVRVPEGQDRPEPAPWNHLHGLPWCSYDSNDH